MGKIKSILVAFLAITLLLMASCTKATAPGSANSDPGTDASSSGSSADISTIPSFDASEFEDEPVVDELKVTYLPQGYAVLQSCGQNMLVDGCAAEDVDAVSKALTDMGIDRLQYIVVPNADETRYGGVQELIDQFHVALVFTSRAAIGDDAYNDFIERNGTTIMQVGTGGSFNIGTCPIEVVAPIVEEGETAQDTSLVMKARCGNTAFMFTNDAAPKELESLLSADADLKSNVLFLNSRSGEEIPYSVMRLIAPVRIVTANTGATSGEYTAAISDAIDEAMVLVSDGNTISGSAA